VCVCVVSAAIYAPSSPQGQPAAGSSGARVMVCALDDHTSAFRPRIPRVTALELPSRGWCRCFIRFSAVRVFGVLGNRQLPPASSQPGPLMCVIAA
jgi:hypothetical protein